MLPFALKVVWFVLSFTDLKGLLSCWFVLGAFGRSVGAPWGPFVYCVGCTILQGIFCLGMIWKMNPFIMPRGFCIAQTVISSFGAFLLTGVTFAFSLATSLAVLKPKTWGDSHQAFLNWRPAYSLPIIIFPIVGTAIHVAFVVKFNSVHPTDDFHCDSTNPEWVRFLGYSGLPFVLSIPSYISIKSIVRVDKTNKHLKRSRHADMDDDAFTPVPISRKQDTLQRVEGHTMPSRPPSVQLSVFPNREPTSPSISNPSLSPHKFHLPFTTPFREPSSSPDTERRSSPVSSSFPTFINPANEVSSIEEQKKGLSSEFSTRSEVKESRDWRDVIALENADDIAIETGDNKSGSMKWSVDDTGKSEYDIGKEDDVISGELGSDSYRPRPPSRPFCASGPRKGRRRVHPNLAPAIWRMIIFQVTFASMQLLTCISTLVDVISQRAQPSPLGTQHFTLLFAAWGPVILFGHLPEVRQHIIAWRRKS
ncbi:hypothetical protein K443DRAFT_677212 [Laccaria amethystina LaAM-08-1]|uniref:Uncharacterized protein n=1 Tax=Laccaria amethystina LaAM-08-1 TaxID=1095629 RepID=A0A0C9Y441_9AGAR|nr:hypothetical protein K443DRAFT_677212 [Laccaria amethystina LaAM-08-1]